MISTEQLAAAVRRALDDAGLPDREPAFERPRNREHGDWATNVALTLAGEVGRPPREVAQAIADHLHGIEGVSAVEVAGPGFLNFHLTRDALGETIRTVAHQGTAWGRGGEPVARRANVEFVSANPTGPLHIGHARWIAVGDAIASLLEAVGWEVTREYYFNDTGTQMERFGASVLAAMRDAEPPEDGYQGDYITALADELAVAGVAEQDVGEVAYQRMLERIKATLERFGVHFDVYFGERSLHNAGTIDAVVDRLREAGHAYEADGAVWLRTSAFGDEKDRVLIRANGQPTYFAADCAYLMDKVQRGFDRCVYVLGADHHGYVGRLQAIARAEGLPEGTVEVIIGQLVNFVRGGERAKMSKRSGALTTCDDLLDEVGPDAARYTFLRYSTDQSIDFDLEAVVREDRDNPVYYVQYSHARIAGIMRTAEERGVEAGAVDEAPVDLLGHATETDLLRKIAAYPESVRFAAEVREPHRIARYAEELAEAFHKFYTECTVIGDDPDLTRARYWLCVATRQTLVNALGLLGVSAPDRM